jgi:putative endonuclease
MRNHELWWVYLLRCVGERYYVGMSQNVAARVKQHRLGQAALFTRGHAVERVVGAVPIGSRCQAARFERKAKRWSTERKISFFAEYANTWHPDRFSLITSTERAPHMPRLGDVLLLHTTTTQQLAEAELAVWTAIKQLSPELSDAIRQTGLDERAAAAWICYPIEELGNSPAQLIARDQLPIVLSLVLRALNGIP